jgi:hypothetical protein
VGGPGNTCIQFFQGGRESYSLLNTGRKKRKQLSADYIATTKAETIHETKAETIHQNNDIVEYIVRFNIQTQFIALIFGSIFNSIQFFNSVRLLTN